MVLEIAERKEDLRDLDARLKQSGQLPSKGRFYAAPFIGMLQDGALRRHAAHANAMAARLAALSPFPLAHPVEANAVFVRMDEPALQRLNALGWFVYRFLDGSVRFISYNVDADNWRRLALIADGEVITLP